jgi:hypothetical protein
MRIMPKISKRSKGQTFVIAAIAAVGLVGALSLGTDVAVLYYNWVQLQKAADASALAGANWLPGNPTQASSTANSYAQSNGILAGEITSTVVASNDQSITISLQRNVPYNFGRVLGLTSTNIAASATAGAPYAPSTVNAATPAQVPSGGDSNGVNGTTCATTCNCGLVPVGLDANTVYSNDEQLTLQQGQLGPGNWDLLALGATGGANLRTNIANGYNSIVTVGDWLTTEPGKKVGPVDQGFQDRLSCAQSTDPTGTYLSHSLTNPRVMVLPVVDWEGQNGRKQVLLKAFATVWLDSYNGGQVTVHFISQVVANSFGSPTATQFGALGSPILTK